MTQINTSMLPVLARLAWRDLDGNQGHGEGWPVKFAQRLVFCLMKECPWLDVWLEDIGGRRYDEIPHSLVGSEE